jgi:hypothetical protein
MKNPAAQRATQRAQAGVRRTTGPPAGGVPSIAGAHKRSGYMPVFYFLQHEIIIGVSFPFAAAVFVKLDFIVGYNS